MDTTYLYASLLEKAHESNQFVSVSKQINFIADARVTRMDTERGGAKQESSGH